ncbi:MAG: His/Gly/Thr/Pro-type tRNA ligase C-terminal domain-containing protein, partial [Synechococcus sp.]
EQLDDEFLKVVDLILSVFERLGLKDFSARLSFRDPNSDKYLGSDEAWEKAQGAIRRAVQKLEMPYFEEEGEAAFYGPKLDFIFRDVLDREWQLGTVQVDYQLPERFDLEYVAVDGIRKRPVMIHRAPFGSLERLVGILIEQYAGDFPFWLAPEQVRILPVSDQFSEYADTVRQALAEADIRVMVDNASDRLGKKIRNAEKAKIPYMLVVGADEQENQTAAVRSRKGGDAGSLAIADLATKLQELAEQ